MAKGNKNMKQINNKCVSINQSSFDWIYPFPFLWSQILQEYNAMSLSLNYDQ